MDVVVCDCAAGTDEDGGGVVGRLAGTLGGVGFVWIDGTDNDTLDREGGGTATVERGAVCNLVEVRISAETGLNVVSGKSTGRDEGGEGSVVLALRTGGSVLEPFVGSLLSLVVGVLGDRRLVKIGIGERFPIIGVGSWFSVSVGKVVSLSTVASSSIRSS